MTKGVYNNQGRKSGGYRKSRIIVGDNNNVNPTSLPCEEERHLDCDGYLTFFPKLKGYKCTCACHKQEKDCKHKDFKAQVNVIRLEDSHNFMAEVKVECRKCHTPFQFIGMPMGLSFTKPMVEVMAAEARLPIKPMDKNLVEKYKQVEKEVNKLKGGSNSPQS